MKISTRLSRFLGTALIATGLVLTLGACGDDNGNGGGQDAGQDMGQDMGMEGTASVQIIHNSADPNASTVDIFANGDLLVDDLEFRTATEFVEVPAGDYSIAIGAPDAGDNETLDDGEALDSWDVTLEADTSYTVVADGVIETGNFAENPDQADIALDLKVESGALAEASNEQGIDLRFHHGATDVGEAQVFSGSEQSPSATLDYGDFSGYLSFDNANVLRTFDARFDGAASQYVQVSPNVLSAGSTATVLASGFADPSANQDGPELDIVACPATAGEGGGDFIQCVPLVEAARVQIIHASPDPAASEVDLYVNDNKFNAGDPIPYLGAFPYITLPSGTEFPVDVVPGGQGNPDNPIGGEQTLGPLSPGSTQAVVASGVTGGDAGTGFALRSGETIQFTGDASQVGLTLFHGAPDAPNVDVIANNPADDSDLPLAEDLAFGSFGNVGAVDAVDYTPLRLLEAGTETTLFSYDVSALGTLGGNGIVAIAHGYVNPPSGVSDREFGVTAFLPNGMARNLTETGE